MFSDIVLDMHIAPGASQLTAVDIPDMSCTFKESRFWIANYFLNCAVGPSYRPPMNAYAYNFLRRAQFAFSEHALAREATIGFVASRRPAPQKYAEALLHWEVYLGQAWHAYSLFITAWEGRAFEKNDGSVEQRLNAMLNRPGF